MENRLQRLSDLHLPKEFLIAERKRQRDKREKVSAFSLFYWRLSEVVKNLGLLCRKVTLNCLETVEDFSLEPTKKLLKLDCYVTLGLAACSVDL